MTQYQIQEALRNGQICDLYAEGLLDVSDLRFAVSQGWMTIEDATSWYEVLMDI